MIKVYFESKNHAELVAKFNSEELYNLCLPVLVLEAQKHRMVVTESVDDDSEITTFMYFANNFPNNWIDLVWADSLLTGRHLNEKWNALNQSNDIGGTLNFFKLFMMLGVTNKKTLLTWIDNNYEI